MSVVSSSLVVIAVARGFLHYGEQYCNHFIAFKLLAIIRHKVFAALRKLAPAKMEGRDKGNLISVLTSDIELLEVFYAHTISPIVIALITSVIMVLYIGHMNIYGALIAIAAYIVIGIILPVMIGHFGADQGLAFRNEFGDMNSFILDSLRGISETIQYGDGQDRKEAMSSRSIELGQKQKQLNRLEAMQRSLTNLMITVFSVLMLILLIEQYQSGNAGIAQVILCTVSMMSSFGPVVALSSLSNNLNQTLASGERVLSILEEKPQVAEKEDGVDIIFTGAKADHVDFSYGDEVVLRDCSIEIPKGKITGIQGPSGCGKSTLLKLMMRFWDTDKGIITISGKDIREINTGSLRSHQAYVVQSTDLFHDTIARNISIGRIDADREDIIEAAKKASLHEFVMSLPEGYDTVIEEQGDNISGGERQRIGIARAFLSDHDFWLLDEPTSNLDSLNEGIILKSLKEQSRDKTILIVSHRKSTMGVCDIIYNLMDLFSDQTDGIYTNSGE